MKPDPPLSSHPSLSHASILSSWSGSSDSCKSLPPCIAAHSADPTAQARVVSTSLHNLHLHRRKRSRRSSDPPQSPSAFRHRNRFFVHLLHPLHLNRRSRPIHPPSPPPAKILHQPRWAPLRGPHRGSTLCPLSCETLVTRGRIECPREFHRFLLLCRLPYMIYVL